MEVEIVGSIVGHSSGDQQAPLVSANKNPAIIETRGYFQSRKLAHIPKRYGMAYLGSPQDVGNIKRVPLA